MYNGIGVQTARGTGTSGHVTKNLGSVRHIRQFHRKAEGGNEMRAVSKDADPGIILHNALRTIEVSLIKLRDKLEEEYVSFRASRIILGVSRRKQWRRKSVIGVRL